MRLMSRATSSNLTIALRGPSGEPVDFVRTTTSHGLTDVVPFSVKDEGQSLSTVIRLPNDAARVIELTAAAPGDRSQNAGTAVRCRARVRGPRLTPMESDAVRATLVRILALDVDLKPFYDDVANDPMLSWACAGAGRLVRSQTVFEDVIRTICTTNCAFSATRRMITALVAELGDPSAGAPATSSSTDTPAAGRAFPTPAAVASAGALFLRDRARLGYRAEYVAAIAERTAAGTLDLELLRPSAPDAVGDDEARTELLELPGVGPYGAAHSMMLMGRNSALILDSWSRPAYARLAGTPVNDGAIRRRFDRYGAHAGLAFWLAVTRSWGASTAWSLGPTLEPV